MARIVVVAALLALVPVARGEDVIKGVSGAFAKDGWVKVEPPAKPGDAPEVYLAVFAPGVTPTTPGATSATPYRLLFRDRERHAEAVKWHGRKVGVFGHLGSSGSEDFVLVTWMQEDKRKKD